MFLSFAQRLEDFILDGVFSDVGSGVYVDVGGGHPVADNVSYHFYLKGWEGLVVEPQTKLAALYGRLRPRDRVVDNPVGAANGKAVFHEVDRLHGFSTLVHVNAQRAAQQGVGIESAMRTISTLSSQLDSFGMTKIDFLKIDVEGAEAAVIAGLDLERHRPKVFCVEALAPGTLEPAHGDWEPVLLDASYAFSFFDGLNRYYVAREHAELASRFPAKIPDWGSARHFYELGRVLEQVSHPDRALAMQLIRGFLASLPFRSPDELKALLVAGRDPQRPEAGVNWPQHASLSDQDRAALGRIAAEYDGGMIGDAFGE